RMAMDRTRWTSHMTPNGCPDRDELARFAVGDLDGPNLSRVAGHVERCAECESALRDLDTYADPLVAGLRRPASLIADVPAELIAAARSVGTSQTAAGPAAGPPRRVGSVGLIAGAWSRGLRRGVLRREH